MGRRVVEGEGDVVLRIGDQRRRLPLSVPLLAQRRDAAAVADGGRLEHVAVGVHRQRQGVLEARVGRLALVVIGEGLARVSEEDGMPPLAARLQPADGEVLLGDGVGVAMGRVGSGANAIEGVGLLAQHHALQGAGGLALLFESQPIRQSRIVQQAGGGLLVVVAPGRLAVVLIAVGGIEQPGEEARDAVAAEIDAGVVPGAGQHRRHVAGGVLVVAGGQRAGRGQRGERLRVRLLHQAKAAELALFAVEVAVVVGVGRHEAAAADVVVGLDALHDVDGEGQAGDPRPAGLPVLQVELRRGGIVEARLGAQVVDDAAEQVGLRVAHQVDVAHRPAGVTGQGRRPDQAGRAVAQQVGGHDVGHIVHLGEDAQRLGRAPAVARLVEDEAHAVAVEVDEVGRAAAVYVGQAQSPLLELVGVVEPGGVVHRHLGPEAAVAQVGPVAHLAVAHAGQVGQPVAAHVGQVDGLRAVGEDQARPALLVARLGRALGRAKARFGQRRMPDEGVVLGDKHVGATVAVQVNQAQIGVAQGAVEAGSEGAERLPALGVVVLIEAGQGAVEHDQVGLPVAGQIHELRPATQGQIGPGGHQLHRGELRLHVLSAFVAGHVAGLPVGGAEVALIEPRSALFGQDTGHALAVQVGPLIPTVQPGGQVRQAGRVHLLDDALHHRPGVVEGNRRQTALPVAGPVAAVAGLGDGQQAGVDRVAGGVGGLLVGVGEVGRAHQAVGQHVRLVGEVVEQQHTLAEAVGAHLEAGAVGREGVVAARPGAGLGRGGGIGVVVAIVEDDLEHPAGVGNLGRGQQRRPSPLAVQQRGAIAVADVLDGAIDPAARVGLVAAIGLVGLAQIKVGRVLGLVIVDHGVAPVVARLADKPAEDAAGVGRVGDTGVGVFAVEGQNVVFGDGAPVDVAGVRPDRLRPALDAGEQPFDARPVATDAIVGEAGRVVRRGHRHEIFRAGEQEDVGLGVVVVAGQPFVRLAADLRQGQRPAEAERAIAGAGVIAEGELRAEAGAAGAGGDGHGQGAGTGNGVGGELLADATDGPAALGQRDGRGLEGRGFGGLAPVGGRVVAGWAVGSF